MATDPIHGKANLAEIHRPHNWEYASAAARNADSGFAVEDVNKLALQLDDYSYWILTDHTTGSWRRVGSPIFNSRGVYDASSNLFPATGGSGGGGAIIADDIWYISVVGTLGGVGVIVGDAIRALTDAPAQDAAKWQIYPKNTEILGEETIIKDTVNGIVGKTGDKIHFYNVARTFKSLLSNVNTAIRDYVFPDMTGEVSVLGVAKTIASAASTDLGSTLSPHTNITGVFAIIDFGTAPIGTYRHGIFTESQSVLTYHVTKLITPDLEDIVVEAGAQYTAISLGSGDWQILSYRRPSGDVPAGTMLDYMGAGIPANDKGYVLAIGQNLLRVGKYAKLYAAIGLAWGVGDGSTTFTLPDSRRRVTVGDGGTGSAELGNALSNIGGEEDHVLTEAELAAHAHNLKSDHTGTSVSAWADTRFGFSNPVGAERGETVTQTGGDVAHNTIQPSMIVTKIIKY